MKDLRERLELAKANARKSLQEGDLEKGREYKQEAETLLEAINELQQVDALKAADAEPVRPPLPEQGLGTILADEPPERKPTPGASVMKAAYVTRFGSEDALVHSILTELHGSDYVGLYWKQKQAFNKYLRRGDNALDYEERRTLRGIVYTPKSIRAGLAQGIYDTGVFKATMVEGRDELGGYSVPIDFNERVIDRLPGYTVIRPRATVIQTGRDMVSIPKGTGGDDQYTSAVRMTWVDETPTATQAETNLTFGMESIPIQTVMATTPISRNLLEDAFFNLESYLADKFAESGGIDEDNQCLTGTGGPRPLGILPGSANLLALTEEDTGDADLLTWDGAGAAVTKHSLIGVIYAIASQYLPRASWLMERATVEEIRMMKDGSGRYLWEPDQQVGQPLMLLGYPVYMQEAMPTIAAGAYPIIFGDLSGYYIADRVGMTVERFLDSATASTNTVKFVMRRRLGGKVCEDYKLAVVKVSA